MNRAVVVLVALTILVGVALATPGEDCSDPIDIPSVPTGMGGNTCGFQDDYEWPCPNESEAPDVVYRYTPYSDQCVNLSLCITTYDSKLIVYEGGCSGDPIACNDFGTGFCEDETHAYIEALQLVGGHTYYIVVEGGYWQQCGEYELRIRDCFEDRPCQSCTPVNAELGTITTTVCGDSIAGNLGGGGKWVASFEGVAGNSYVWDLCPIGICHGHDTFGSDPDIVILDPSCDILLWDDGPDSCNFRPNELTWMCPSNGTYYVVVGSYPAYSAEGDSLNCYGSGEQTFMMYYYALSGRPCTSCEPVNEELGDLPTLPCGGSVYGNCGWGGKWIASFVGYQDVVYHWDLCAMEPCSGASEFDWTDADIVILDGSCSVLEWHDGMEACGYRPNDYQWMCPAGGTYYVMVTPFPALLEDTLTCMGQSSQTFTLVYWRDEGPIPGGEACDDATVISGPWPRTITWNTCSSINDYDVECWQPTWTDGRDVVYQYTPAVDEFVTLSLCESFFDSKLIVFADSCAGRPWACNDIDLTGTCSHPMYPFLPCIELLAGHTYYIVVDAVNDIECGDFSLTISACTPIEGDVIQTAWSIPSLPYSVSGTTDEMYDQYVEECAGLSYSRDAVYAYTPPSDVTVEIDLAKSEMPLHVIVYENSRATLFACDDNGAPGWRAYIAPFTMYGGNTYYVVIGGDWDLHGAYHLEIMEPVLGRCCMFNEWCAEYVSSRQCSYHLSHGTWTEGLTCASPCPELPPPPPGPIDSATVPVNNGCLYGVTLASNCDGELFYNNTCSETLYTTNKDGERLAAVGFTLDGWSTWCTVGCWDASRQMLWSVRDDHQVYLLDPATGVLTLQFGTPYGTYDMDLDPVDSTLWLHEPDGNLLYHYGTDGTLIEKVFPLDTNGIVEGNLRGVCSGVEGTIYVSHADGRVTQHDKATGAWRGLFATSDVWQSRALTCDAFSFAPQTVIWWKFDTTYYAYAAPTGTCTCGGCPPADSLSIIRDGVTNRMLLYFVAPEAGTYGIYSTTDPNSVYPEGFGQAGLVAAVAGQNQWADTTGIVPYSRYTVVHLCP